MAAEALSIYCRQSDLLRIKIYIYVMWFSWKELSNSRPFYEFWDKNETKKILLIKGWIIE